jgi:hypothetical protein
MSPSGTPSRSKDTSAISVTGISIAWYESANVIARAGHDVTLTSRTCVGHVRPRWHYHGTQSRSVWIALREFGVDSLHEIVLFADASLFWGRASRLFSCCLTFLHLHMSAPQLNMKSMRSITDSPFHEICVVSMLGTVKSCGDPLLWQTVHPTSFQLSVVDISMLQGHVDKVVRRTIALAPHEK